MDSVTAIKLNHTVETTGTNWDFDGCPENPQWGNTETDHKLVVTPQDTMSDTYSVHLSHPSLIEGSWEIAEADFAGELIPLVEWILSAPEDTLTHEETASLIVAPFWDSPVSKIE
jgi:hypothetical protein